MSTSSEERRFRAAGDSGSPLGPAPENGVRARESGSGPTDLTIESRTSADEPTRASGGSHAVEHDSEAVAAEARIAGYALHDEIYRGGQGVVYRAMQLGTKRAVALKVLLEGPFAGETARRRFEREVELAASLRHPNIVTILDSGISQGRYYFAMEYIDGLRLDRYLAQQRPGLRATLKLFDQICAAVNFAHQRGVIHRDLKPSNILIDAEGQPRILDFGLAKPARGAESDETTVQVLSTAGQVLGTLAYMSPEQAVGSQDVDVRSDVYSLGVVFYEALLGQPPYPITGSMGEILQRIVHAEPARPRALRNRSRFGRLVDDELETIVLKALEKDPARRYQTAGDLGCDLRRHLAGEPIEAKRASGFYILRKTLRRYRLHAAAAGFILMMLVGFLIVFAYLYTNEKSARAEADRLRTDATDKAQRAAAAERSERAAREVADDARRGALAAADELRGALVQQKIQRGDLARARGDLADARDSYWDAYDDAEGTAALWALRRYYLETPDHGARLLQVQRVGPSALASDGTTAAVCDGPQSVTIREVETARTLAWVRTPGDVTTVMIDDGRLFAAAGPRWARVWRVGSSRPLTAIELPDHFQPLSIHALDGCPWILLVGYGQDYAAQVNCYRAADGTLTQSLPLRSHVAGTPDFAGRSDAATRAAALLAVPTAAGVVLVAVTPEGALTAEVVWFSRLDVPRAVRFVGGDSLAVLADALRVGRLDGSQRDEWERLVSHTADWDFFDITPDSGAPRSAGVRDAPTVVLASHDGRVAVYRDGQLQDEWRATQAGLEHARLEPDRQTLVTLDRLGRATHWVPHSPEQQRRLIFGQSPTNWASSGDGSVVLLANAEGQVFAYDPRVSTELFALPGPRTLSVLTRQQPSEELALAISRDGSRAVIRQGSWVRLITLRPFSLHLARWSNPSAPILKDVALSDNGFILAFGAQSPAGDRQLISFCTAEPHARKKRTVSLEDLLPPACQPVSFVGSLIRRMMFVPHSEKLLVARSNGELSILDAGRDERGHRRGAMGGPTEAPMPWVVLDSPAAALAFDREGGRLAVACDDQTVRFLDPGSGKVTGRIEVGEAVLALDFNARGDVLMVRTTSGVLRLYETASFELLVDWSVSKWTVAGTPQPAGQFQALAGPAQTHATSAPSFQARQPGPALWSGDEDAMILGYGGGVYEHQYRVFDERLRGERAYAGQREIARRLAAGDFAAAWSEAARLREQSESIGLAMQQLIVEAELRRAGHPVAPEWCQAVLRGAAPATLLRLGHAAYDGGHFELAREWLRQGYTQSDGDVDAYTLWRMAGCAYLADQFEEAANALATLPGRADLDAADIPLVELQWAASLNLAGRTSAARAVVLQLGQHPRSLERADLVRVALQRVVAQFFIGAGSDSLIATTFERMLTSFAEQSLFYRDDLHFFAGETARRRGDPAEARAQYQHCLDVARDEWPANWARYRLAQLTHGKS